MKIIRNKARNPLAESFAEPFDLEQEIEFRKLIAVEELLQFMKREGINRTELAERMGVGPSRITAMLSGHSNLTIDTLVRAGRAVGAELHQTYAPKGKKVKWTAYDPSETHEAFLDNISTTPVNALDVKFTLSATAFDDDKQAA